MMNRKNVAIASIVLITVLLLLSGWKVNYFMDINSGRERKNCEIWKIRIFQTTKDTSYSELLTKNGIRFHSEEWKDLGGKTIFPYGFECSFQYGGVLSDSVMFANTLEMIDKESALTQEERLYFIQLQRERVQQFPEKRYEKPSPAERLLLRRSNEPEFGQDG